MLLVLFPWEQEQERQRQHILLLKALEQRKKLEVSRLKAEVSTFISVCSCVLSLCFIYLCFVLYVLACMQSALHSFSCSVFNVSFVFLSILEEPKS